MHSPPEFQLGDSKTLEVKSVLKILGVQVQSDYGWGAQISQMALKASKTIWLLRRMKQLGIDEQTITNYWNIEGRCNIEFCALVWSGGITVSQARDLTRVQKRAVAAVTRSWREDYTAVCTRIGIEADLGSRRHKLWKTFAQKTATNACHQDIFIKLDNPPQTRGGGKVWREPRCKTRRHLQSARPYLTRLLNKEDK